MGGGLMQIVAYGAQDIYLTGNPQITFFKVVYRRHTNFSIECIDQIIKGNEPTLTAGSDVYATISREGDLISNMHLEISFTGDDGPGTSGDYINWCHSTGHAYIKSCELEIGGHLIDKHYGQWLDIWNELTDHDTREWPMLNKYPARTDLVATGYGGDKSALNDLRCYVPLKFWFCRNYGLALPIIALQYHEVKVKFSFRSLNGLINYNGASATSSLAAHSVSTKLWVDYIYLDTDERRRFAQTSHEYLIEQVQYAEETLSTKVQLYFSHPVKELIWVGQDPTVATERTTQGTTQNASGNDTSGGGAFTHGNDYFNYMSTGSSPSEYINGKQSHEHFTTAKLTFNGHDRFPARNASYFSTIQPLQAGHRIPTKHVYMYSFALKPEEHQPSGTCNFSRIDNAYLEFGSVDTTGSKKIHIYATNYNVLRITSGMGGLAYTS